MIYLDHASTSPPRQEYIRYFQEVLSCSYTNPNSQHFSGKLANQAIESIREQLAKYLGVNTNELIFTSGGTESNHLALEGLLRAQPKKRHILTSRLEHESVHAFFEQRKEQGYDIEYVEHDSHGRLQTHSIQKRIREDMAFVSLIQVQNEFGHHTDFSFAKDLAVPLHVDGVQAFGKYAMPQGADVFTGSFHKLGAIKGLGFIVKRRGVQLYFSSPGARQEQNFRSGTQSVEMICALEPIIRSLPWSSKPWKEVLSTVLEDTGCVWISDRQGSEFIASLAFPGVPAEVLVRVCSDAGLAIATGSACHAKGTTRALQALGLEPREEMGVVRLSFAYDTSFEDVKKAALILRQSLEWIKEMGVIE